MWDIFIYRIPIVLIDSVGSKKWLYLSVTWPLCSSVRLYPQYKEASLPMLLLNVPIKYGRWHRQQHNHVIDIFCCKLFRSRERLQSAVDRSCFQNNPQFNSCLLMPGAAMKRSTGVWSSSEPCRTLPSRFGEPCTRLRSCLRYCAVSDGQWRRAIPNLEYGTLY